MAISREERKLQRQRRRYVRERRRLNKEYFRGRVRLNRHVFRHGAPPAGSVIYDPYQDMSMANGIFENGKQKNGLTVIKPVFGGYEEIGTGAYNTDIPDFYLIGLAGRPYEPVFPTNQAKKYMIECFRRALPLFPVEIQSYSILNNSAYCVIASFDQTRVSAQRFLSLVIRSYVDYYNKKFDHTGSPFMGRPTIKKLGSCNDIADKIMLVQRQPMVRGIHGTYPFCSLGEGENGITSRTAFQNRFGAEGQKEMKEAGSEEYGRLHAIDLSTRLFGYRAGLNRVIEEVLIDFGCFTKRAIPHDLMPKIIAEIVERTRAPYKKVIKKLGAGWNLQYELLIATIAEMIIGDRHTFDYAWRILRIELLQKRTVAIDVAILMFERLGYSIDQIFQMMGFAYAAVIGGKVEYYNDDFLVRVIKDYAAATKTPVISVINAFGIRNSQEDPDRVKQVAAYFM